jgi:hypothetical protein
MHAKADSIRLMINHTASAGQPVTDNSGPIMGTQVSAFLTLPKICAEAFAGKWLNIRKLVGYGTPLASNLAEAPGMCCLSQHARGGQMKSILDPSFRYTKSVETDLRKTFARVRRELRQQQQEQPKVRSEEISRVLPFATRRPASGKHLMAAGRDLKDMLL